MNTHPTSGRPAVVTIIRILLVFDAVATLGASALHVAGVRIPLGSAVFVEPQMVAAAIVEGLVGVVFAFSSYAVFSSKPSAWASALFAHLFAIAGFLLGIYATRNGTSPFNADYHRVMMAVFVVGVILLALPATRTALGRGPRGA